MDFYSIKNEGENGYSCNGEALYVENVILAEPTYDLTFKYIFSQQNTQKISGIDRSISLLNTLIYQNEIESLQEVNIEFVEYYPDKNKKSEPLRALRSDLAFKIKLKDKNDCNSVQLINIEMQIGYPAQFLERLIQYGLLLKKINKGQNNKEYKTLVLGFINYNKDIDLKSNSYFLSEINSKDNTLVRKVDGFVDIIIINLFEISKKLENNEKIYILGKEIGDIGKNWLKLLSLRHWAKKLENNTYIIPNICDNKEINSAIEYLISVKNNKLKRYYEIENEYGYKMKEEAKNLAKEISKEEVNNAKKEAENAKKEAEDAKMEVENIKQQMEEEKEERENDKLKIFFDLYKKFNNSLEDYENIRIIDFSELDMEKVIAFWGNEEKYEEKLKALKEFIEKKRKK